MSFLCLLVFSICVFHNSLLTLDVFLTEHGCNHWVGWGESFALQIQHDCYLSNNFLFSFSFSWYSVIAARAWLWCDLFRVHQIILNPACIPFLSTWFHNTWLSHIHFILLIDHWGWQTVKLWLIQVWKTCRPNG